jgi:hypothetical protein
MTYLQERRGVRGEESRAEESRAEERRGEEMIMLIKTRGLGPSIQRWWCACSQYPSCLERHA